ncbi:MAG: hypothetical protein NXI28_09920, partial [bacterium]|nr:hypothetical protein [bacterium]
VSAPGWLRRISSPNTDLYSLSQITQCGAIALVHDAGTISPDKDRFYLLPAKKWVSSPEEVLEEWELWRERTF